MKITLVIWLLAAVSATIFAAEVPVLTVDGAINTVSAKYLMRNMERAREERAPCVVIMLDTPGGLMSSTEDITKAMMASQVPIVIYVHPKGGRAASAGVFLTYASHIAAMTPGTRIGAAHPVSMMGGGQGDTLDTMMEKVANDAVANLRSMASERGRNEEWSEDAVIESKSITADEALEIGVVEILAENMEDLLISLDSMAYGPSGKDTLALPDPVLDYRPMTSTEKFLFTILNPNIAYLLMMLGMVGIYLELQNPGIILPGVVGGISILLALYAFQILPVNYAGVALIILAVALFIIETQTPTFGLLTTGGIVALLAGSFLLTSGNPSIFVISWKIIIPTVIVASAFLIFIIWKAVAARFAKPETGEEGLVGATGVVAKPSREGLRNVYVEIHGELWAAEGENLEPGDNIVVEKTDGNRLIVRKA